MPVESAPHWDATGDTLTFADYTGPSLEGLWQPTHAPVQLDPLESHWKTTGSTLARGVCVCVCGGGGGGGGGVYKIHLQLKYHEMPIVHNIATSYPFFFNSRPLDTISKGSGNCQIRYGQTMFPTTFFRVAEGFHIYIYITIYNIYIVTSFGFTCLLCIYYGPREHDGITLSPEIPLFVSSC